MRVRFVSLFVSCLIAVVAVAATRSADDIPQVMQIVSGILLVFLLPGFSLVSAILPEPQLSRGERLLASIGMSLAITICVALLLGALPVGLSRPSVAVGLGGWTIVWSVLAELRTLSTKKRDETGSKGSGPSMP